VARVVKDFNKKKKAQQQSAAVPARSKPNGSKPDGSKPAAHTVTRVATAKPQNSQVQANASQ
jgi:hypothetical protein